MTINGFGRKQYYDASELIQEWQPIYRNSHPEMYNDHIGNAL